MSAGQSGANQSKRRLCRRGAVGILQRADAGPAGERPNTVVTLNICIARRSTTCIHVRLNLQGPELSYDGMRLVPGHALPAQPGILPLRLAGALPPLRPAEPVLDLRLAVRVLGFPPSNPQF